MRLFVELPSQDRGTEIVEAALVLPLVFFLMFGVFWFGRAFNISSTLARAAKEGVSAASLSTCGSCGNTVTANTAVADAVESILSADHLGPANVQFYTPTDICLNSPLPSCNASAITATDGSSWNIKVCTHVPLTCGTGGSGCGGNSPPACGNNPVLGTRVSMAYSFDFLRLSYDPTAGITKLPTVTLPATAQTIPED